MTNSTNTNRTTTIHQNKSSRYHSCVRLFPFWFRVCLTLHLILRISNFPSKYLVFFVYGYGVLQNCWWFWHIFFYIDLQMFATLVNRWWMNLGNFNRKESSCRASLTKPVHIKINKNGKTIIVNLWKNPTKTVFSLYICDLLYIYRKIIVNSLW